MKCHCSLRFNLRRDSRGVVMLSQRWLLVRQPHLVISFPSSLVMAVTGTGLVAAAPGGPVQVVAGRVCGPGQDRVHPADLVDGEADQRVAVAAGDRPVTAGWRKPGKLSTGGWPPLWPGEHRRARRWWRGRAAAGWPRAMGEHQAGNHGLVVSATVTAPAPPPGGRGGRARPAGSRCGRPEKRGWLPGSRRRTSSAFRRR
jgi:hypothetical protein